MATIDGIITELIPRISSAGLSLPYNDYIILFSNIVHSMACGTDRVGYTAGSMRSCTIS